MSRRNIPESPAPAPERECRQRGGSAGQAPPCGGPGRAGAGSEPGTAGPEVAARQRWMGILARSSAAELEEALDRAAAGLRPGYAFLRRPETGLAMVRGRMDGAGRPFNLGEMTLTRCAVRTADGRTGLAYVAGRDARRAELAAFLDALLQDPARQAGLLAVVVEPLAAGLEARQREARSRTRATKVDFFTLVRGDDE